MVIKKKICFNFTSTSNLIFFFINLLFIPKIFSQELVTDRPDQTESAVTVPLNSLQIETGFVYEGFKEKLFIPFSGEAEFIIDNYSAGTLLRFGIIDNIELRLGADYLIRKESGSSINGFNDFLFGTKINFLNEEDDDFLNLGILIHTSLPIGDELLTSDEFEPEVIAAFSKTLSEQFSLSANIGGNSSDETMNIIYTTALGISLTNKLGFFAEVFGNITADIPVHFLDGGFTYLISDNVQLDLSGGKGLSGINSYWFIGTGISFRIDDIM